jgi:chromosome segregation ATPase
MSEFTEIKSNIKKITSIFNTLNNLNQDHIPKLEKYPPDLSQLVQDFEDEKQANMNQIDKNADEIETLKNKIAQNRRDIKNLQEKNETLEAKKQNLENNINEVQTETKKLKEKISLKKQELENRESRLRELEANVQQMTLEQQKFESKMNELENNLKEKYEKRLKFANSYENRIRAMKLLIKKEYVHSPQVQLLNALQVGTTLDLRNILQAFDIKRNKAQDILKDLVEQGGPIEYNETAGTVTLKEEVDFKQ